MKYIRKFQGIKGKVGEGRTQGHCGDVNSGGHGVSVQKSAINNPGVMTPGLLTSSSQDSLTCPTWAVSTSGSFSYEGLGQNTKGEAKIVGEKNTVGEGVGVGGGW